MNICSHLTAFRLLLEENQYFVLWNVFSLVLCHRQLYLWHIIDNLYVYILRNNYHALSSMMHGLSLCLIRVLKIQASKCSVLLLVKYLELIHPDRVINTILSRCTNSGYPLLFLYDPGILRLHLQMESRSVSLSESGLCNLMEFSLLLAWMSQTATTVSTMSWLLWTMVQWRWGWGCVPKNCPQFLRMRTPSEVGLLHRICSVLNFLRHSVVFAASSVSAHLYTPTDILKVNYKCVNTVKILKI